MELLLENVEPRTQFIKGGQPTLDLLYIGTQVAFSVYLCLRTIPFVLSSIKMALSNASFLNYGSVQP